MAKRPKEAPEHEAPVDLASRIGARPAADPAPTPPPPAPEAPHPPRLDGPLPSRRPDRPLLIGAAEPPPPPLPTAEPAADAAKSDAIASPRTPPGPGEIDIVATPIPTLDDWHRFELALRKVRGVGQVRTEYYRHGVLKMRVTYEGAERLANALRTHVPGYRVRVIGEDRTTLQILVSTDGEERRPG